MKWVNDESVRLPIKSWCENVEREAMEQARNLANHPITFRHISLMPDCHPGYGMPIGGVIACDNGVIPNAVGVDIGCGMGAIGTDYKDQNLKDLSLVREILESVKEYVPVGEGKSHKKDQIWEEFDIYLDSIGVTETSLDFNKPGLPGWLDEHTWELAAKNLGTLGGGNHFIELQSSEEGFVYLMLHSGSRNLGYRIAEYYNKLALMLNEKYKTPIPSKQLAFLPYDSKEGKDYIRDMTFALKYAKENRRRMMEVFKNVVTDILKSINFISETNIHHNYAALESHFDKNVWIHRKGATSAKKGEMGIIPGSMGTSSYIVEGLGNTESFMSCSHGAGRVMGRNDACRKLNIEECNKAMEGIVFDRWHRLKIQNESYYDFGESPLAYKNIDTVIESELDLVKPIVKLRPLGVIKG